jgi:hypothetical protein
MKFGSTECVNGFVGVAPFRPCLLKFGGQHVADGPQENVDRILAPRGGRYAYYNAIDTVQLVAVSDVRSLAGDRWQFHLDGADAAEMKVEGNHCFNFLSKPIAISPKSLDRPAIQYLRKNQ